MRPESSERQAYCNGSRVSTRGIGELIKGKKQSMKRETQKVIIQSDGRLRSSRCGHFLRFLALTFLAVPSIAHASLFHGETLDSIANGISWVVLIIGPIIGIVVFWLVHILPEKIAEKKKHPQTKAIQCVCLLSLCFGGILWPLAWLWAYTKPVLHKMAYGTDVDESHGHGEKHADEAQELANLRTRVAELETELRSKSAPGNRGS
jgi:CBS domain containing-hemolysin-like protein